MTSMSMSKLLPPDVLIRSWKKKQQLGKGGCGTVDLAEDLASGAQFVVKSVASCPSKSAQAEFDLDNEFSILQKLQGCPHALQCLGRCDTNADDHGHPTKLLFLEYMDAGSILDIVKAAIAKYRRSKHLQSTNKLLQLGAATLSKWRHPILIPEEGIRFFTCAILQGLVEIHEHGIVHGDIKCANVLLRRRHPGLMSTTSSAAAHFDQSTSTELKLGVVNNGKGALNFEVKLADFGISRQYTDCSTSQLAAAVAGACGEVRIMRRGTYSHMAPEVARGWGAGPAADVWSLGCTVVEMAQGIAPWGNGPQALERQAMGHPPCIPDHLSKMCKDFLGRCLVLEPSARWTPSELLHHPFLEVDHHCHGKMSVSIINILGRPGRRSSTDKKGTLAQGENKHSAAGQLAGTCYIKEHHLHPISSWLHKHFAHNVPIHAQ